MSLYSREKLEEIKSKIDYYEWYKQYLPELTQRGRLAWCCCPWHQETKPSFSIDINYGLYKCWGENLSGDIFSFYMKQFTTTFNEAVEAIAEQVGVTLEVDPELQKELEYKKSLKSINKLMCEKFELALEGDINAWNYLTQIRNISPKIIKEFSIGRGINKLPEKESLKELGLLAKNEKEEYYAKFGSNRITIPFKNEQGEVTSFVGRLCVEDKEKKPAKYMYTTNTTIHNKSHTLFGIYQAKKYIKNFNSVICVEGPIDMIMMYQKGLVNTVALGGLNISDQQVSLLKKYTNNFYICIEDGAMLGENKKDENKRNNNELTPLDKIYNKIKEHIPYAKVYIVDLRLQGGGKCDPDMYLQTHTKEDFKNLLQHAKTYNEFIINEKIKDINPKNIEEKSACINMVIPLLYNISNFLDRKQYIELVANKLCISENDLYRKIKYFTEKQDKLNTENISWDSRPIFAQKILLSMIFCPNFDTYRVLALINFNVLNLMDSFYKSIFTEYIFKYVDEWIKQYGQTSINFSKLFSDLKYNNTNELIYKTIMDIYFKIENFEDLTNDDLDDLVQEQVDTLKEYVITDITEDELNAISI